MYRARRFGWRPAVNKLAKFQRDPDAYLRNWEFWQFNRKKDWWGSYEYDRIYKYGGPCSAAYHAGCSPATCMARHLHGAGAAPDGR